ncbi:MAG TPA: nucleoside diphosphate kinase regulator [Gammaproteobacteria bacterium]|nr:nucleoside diphosphate kinase regulator [Gammaproteobacteria bacterium]
MDKEPKIYVTEADFDALEDLLDSPQVRKLPGIESLWQELHRANVMPAGQIPANVVTMNSTVRFEDESAGTAHQLTLVYPRDVDGSGSKVSITAPVGSALIGLSVGQTIEWQVPGGRKIRLKVLEVLHQPEATK